MAILEDDSGRIAAMRTCLAGAWPGVEPVFFGHAQEMIVWLGSNLGNVVLISLDHDLPLRSQHGAKTDCGTGRQVADYLASVPPTCPVIVHSSNTSYAPGIYFALQVAGWPCSRVYPCDEHAWIVDSWGEEVRRYVRDGWIKHLSTGAETGINAAD